MNLLPFQYVIRRSHRATKARIVVSTNKVEVVAPLDISERSLHQFVSAQKIWILDALKKIEQKSPKHLRFSPESYHHGARIPYQGSFYLLEIYQSGYKRIKIEFSDKFVAFVPGPNMNENASDAIRAALTQWMKQQLKQHVDLIVQRHAPVNNLFPRSVSIKTQRSRWGSCGARNDIHINWLLVLAPPVVLEYVVIHELCHIQFKNHSRFFWDLVAQHMPDYREHRSWLKQYGFALMQGL